MAYGGMRQQTLPEPGRLRYGKSDTERAQDAGDDAGEERLEPVGGRKVILTGSMGLRSQVDRGDGGALQYRHDAHRQGEGRDPPAKYIQGLDAGDAYLAPGDGGRGGTQKEGGEQTTGTEDPAP